jgi:hypothetical protein
MKKKVNLLLTYSFVVDDEFSFSEYVVFSILYLFISLGNVEYRRLLKKFHVRS